MKEGKYNLKSWLLFLMLLFLPVVIHAQEELPGTVTTVDSSAEITINLFDYKGEKKSGNTYYDINNYTDFVFTNPKTSKSWIDTWIRTEPVIQGIARNRLNDQGYPILNTQEPRDAAYLFNPDRVVDGKTTYKNANHLFQKDEDGYYIYDSDQNYAYYNPGQGDNGDFVVYNQTYDAINNRGKIGFFPFNQYKSTDNNLEPSGKYYNHHFGLTISTYFMMPEGGKVNNQDMIFEFSGDDDVWVFIDDVLVLDIGGIHGRAKGRINFATGEVSVDNVPKKIDGRPAEITANTIGATAKIEDIFSEQGKLWDGRWGSNHKLSFFYLERGHYVSNMSLKFNLPTIPPPQRKTIKGTKVWDDESNVEGLRPKKITIELFRNGELIDTKAIEPLDNTPNRWDWQFSDLYTFDPEGKLYTYKVKEVKDNEFYTVTKEGSAEEGYTITNKREPEKIKLTGNKKWDDADGKDGKRPSSIKVNLFANGKIFASQEVTSEKGWAWEFTDLYKYKNGQLVQYTVTEDLVENYITEPIQGNLETGFTITNTLVRDVKGSKTWDDADNQDGKRPSEITVNLLVDGEKIDSQKATAANNWSWEFNNLPKYANGKEIVYTVTENEVTGYKSTIDGFNITNSYKPETIEISGHKIWEDFNNQDGVRPAFVTIKLLADGEDTGKTLILSEANHWTASFTDLDVYKPGQVGQKVEYTVKEEAVGNGYTSVVTGSAKDGFTVTNSRNTEKIDITGSKTWNDNNNQDGVRPSSITIELLKNGQVFKTAVVTSAEDWKWSFTGLDKYEAQGTEINYSIREVSIENYSTEIKGYDVINTHAPGKTSVHVSKAWEDFNNQDGARPATVSIKLYADGEDTGKALTLSEANHWTDGFTDLDVYKPGQVGQKVEYTVQEETVGNGYTSVVTGSATEGFTVTNSRNPEKIDITGSKTWNDNNNQDGLRLESITIKLLKNGSEIQSKKVTAEDGWKWSFDGLDKFENGKEILYSIAEVAITDYSSEVDGFDVTNTHTPGKISVQVTKAWDDEGNRDGKRPDSVTIHLLADGEETGETVTLNSANNWTDTFKNLDIYKVGEIGKRIQYTVKETALTSGYSSVITGDAEKGYVVTNSYMPETTSIKVSKSWKDSDNQDGIRPESIMVYLFANEEIVDSISLKSIENWTGSFDNLSKYRDGKLIKYSIQEKSVAGYTFVVTGDQEKGFEITNTHETEVTTVKGSKTWEDANNQDGKRPESITIRLLANGVEVDRLKVTEKDGWTWTFEDLPKYANGTEIAYTITEDQISDYTSKVEGYNIINSYTPGKTSVTVTKRWEDDDNRDGLRPESVTIQLLANGTETDQEVLLSKDVAWTHTFSDLDEYKAGQKIVYTVKEKALESGYQSKIEGDQSQGFIVINKRSPATMDIPVSKVWDDKDNQDGIRPETVTVKLLADGEDTDKLLILTKENAWKGTFADLPVNKAGQKIAYTLDEVLLGTAYTSRVEGDTKEGFVITNIHTSETLEVSGFKTWKDAENQDGKRPTSITIRLFANGVEVASKVVTEKDGWKWTFDTLPKFSEGELIRYTVSEDTIQDYVTTTDGRNFTNSYTPGKTSVQVTKAWEDGQDQDGLRPALVKVKLLADGVDTGQVLTLDAENKWVGIFTDLDAYKNGKEILYTVEEVPVRSGYASKVTGDAKTGFVITNKRDPETLDIEGKKTWQDEDDKDGLRPDKITIRLYADGTEIAVKTVTAEDDWKWTFTGMAKHDQGRSIAYTLTEDVVSGYTTEVKGYDVTNIHTPTLPQDPMDPQEKPETPESPTKPEAPGKTQITVTKAWKDQRDRDGLRPSEVTVKLYGNGVDTGKSLVLKAGNKWTGSFNDLDVTKDGKKIVYTVQEVSVEGYTAVISGNPQKGFSITNFREPEKIDLEGQKLWKDEGDKWGQRPQSITVRLYAKGKEVASQKVTAADEWKFVFKDLPKYVDGGIKVVYTVKEDPIPKYRSQVKNMTITNTYDPKVVHKTPSPKTGDDFQPFLWVGLGGLALGIVIYLEKKKTLQA